MENNFELHKVRDFSAVFSDSVSFMRKNFKSLGKSLVMIVAPVYVIASLLFSFFSSGFFDTVLSPVGINDMEKANKMLQLIADPRLWISGLLFFCAFMLSISVIFSYIKVYSQKNSSDITPNEVWAELWRRLPKFFFYSIGYGIIIILLYAVIVFLLALIAVAIPILGFIILFFAIIAIMVYLITFISILVPVIFYEDEGFFGSISRTISLIKGNFWQVLGISLVAGLIVGIAQYLVYMIVYVPMLISSVSQERMDGGVIQILTIVYLVLLPIVLFFGYIFQYSISSLTYFSLLEKRNHVGLQMRINTIGNTQADKPDEQY